MLIATVPFFFSSSNLGNRKCIEIELIPVQQMQNNYTTFPTELSMTAIFTVMITPA